MKSTRPRALLTALLAGVSALTLTATTPFLVAPAAAQSAPSTVWGGVPNLADLVEQAAPAVVQITARRPGTGMAAFPQELPDMFRDSPFREFFGPEFGNPEFRGPGAPRAPEMVAGGSGFLVDSEGTIVTNNHVVDSATDVKVTLSDGREFDATVLGVDPKTDLAVLKIEADDLPTPVSWGDSDAARVGDPVFAMGAPFGLGGTVTAGIVSARSRNLNSGPYDDFIQVDAPINQGNSGGPLFNASGEVIGVNSQIFSPTGGNVGIGFAIPSELAQSIVAEIVENGSVERGWLGVSIQPVTREIAESLGLDEAKGAMIAEVTEGGPAAEAELQVGDIVTKFGDVDIDDVHDLTRAVADTESGERVRVAVLRDGRERDIRVEIGAMPNDTTPTKVASAEEGGSASKTGVELDRLGLRLLDDGDGAIIAEVTPDGPAAEAGLQPGDRVLRVNQEEIDSASEAREAVADALDRDRDAVLLQVERDGGRRFVGVPFSVS